MWGWEAIVLGGSQLFCGFCLNEAAHDCPSHNPQQASCQGCGTGPSGWPARGDRKSVCGQIPFQTPEPTGFVTGEICVLPTPIFPGETPPALSLALHPGRDSRDISGFGFLGLQLPKCEAGLGSAAVGWRLALSSSASL